MISVQARDSIERIFFQAARSRLPAADDACEIAAIAGRAPGEHAVVLTISSIAFRLLFVLHFDDDAATQRYYAGDEAGRALRDTFMEIGNLCCGAMNQQLVEHFPDLGMSTPYALSSACVPYLAELRPDYVSSYALTVSGALTLGATLCVCAKASVDFVADVGALEAVDERAGELELF